MRSALLVVPMLALAVAGCGPSDGADKGGHKGGPPGGMPPPEVTAMTVAPKAIPVTFEYVGQTAGSREVEVRARVTGILLKRNFEEGGPVKQGQSLFTIDPAQFEAAVQRTQADVAAAEARLQQAKRNVARFKPLYAERAVSQKDYDDAVSAEQIGTADVAAARARLAEARLNLGYTKVEAPVSGVASKAQRSEGSLVSGPDVLLTSVVQLDPIWVNFGIPDGEASQLRKEIEAGRLAMPKDGRFEVGLRLGDGTQYDGIGLLNFSDVRISASTGTRESRAELPNPKGVLQPGQFVRVLLRGAVYPNAVTVPQRAVLEGPQGKFVYVVNDKSAAEPRPVVAGEWSGGGDWIITSGLKEGDRVIVDGVMKLGPGAPVRIAQAGAEKPAEQQKPAAEQKKPQAKK